jgi:hypothetical protein
MTDRLHVEARLQQEISNLEHKGILESLQRQLLADLWLHPTWMHGMEDALRQVIRLHQGDVVHVTMQDLIDPLMTVGQESVPEDVAVRLKERIREALRRSSTHAS